MFGKIFCSLELHFHKFVFSTVDFDEVWLFDCVALNEQAQGFCVLYHFDNFSFEIGYVTIETLEDSVTNVEVDTEVIVEQPCEEVLNKASNESMIVVFETKETNMQKFWWDIQIYNTF